MVAVCIQRTKRWIQCINNDSSTSFIDASQSYTAPHFSRNLCLINLNLHNISTFIDCFAQYTVNFRVNRYKSPPSRYWFSIFGSLAFPACSAALRDVRTMLAVLNRNLALTTSSLTITGNRALLMSHLGKVLYIRMCYGTMVIYLTPTLIFNGRSSRR